MPPLSKLRPMSWLGLSATKRLTRQLDLAAFRGPALEKLAQLGSRAESALEAVAALLAMHDEEMRDQAAATLLALGDVGLDEVVRQASEHPDAAARVSCLRALARAAGARQRARSALVAALTDPNPDLAREAALGLAALGTSTLHDVKPLLSSPDWKTSEAGLRAISAYGARAVPLLCDWLRDENEQTRYQSCGVLARLGLAARPAIPHLVQRLYDLSDAVRTQAAQALGKMGEAAVIPLIAALRHPESRKWAALALEKIGPEARTALPTLLHEGLRSKEAEVRRWSARVLSSVGAEAHVAAARLLPLLDDPDADVRGEAARALGHIRAEIAVGKLAERLKDPDESVAIEAIRALGRLARRAEDVRATIEECVVRGGRLGEEAEIVLEHLAQPSSGDSKAFRLDDTVNARKLAALADTAETASAAPGSAPVAEPAAAARG